MEELGGKSLFKSLPDWHERPILGAMLEHGKDVHATGEELDCLSASGHLTDKFCQQSKALTRIPECRHRTGSP